MLSQMLSMDMDTASEDSVLIVNDPERSSLLTPTESTLPVTCKIYKRRWYVLTVYTAQAVIFNMTWNTWSPIQKPCKISFGWTDFDLLLLSSWAPISYLVTSAPLTWLMDRKGEQELILRYEIPRPAGVSSVAGWPEGRNQLMLHEALLGGGGGGSVSLV